jgi:hypothetical protein
MVESPFSISPSNEEPEFEKYSLGDESKFSRYPLEPQFPNSFLCFLHEFTEFDKFDTPERGYKSGIYLEHDGKIYPVYFYHPIRLSQDLEISIEHGYGGYVAEYGMIAIDDVTLERMIEVLISLLKSRYFDKQKSYTYDELLQLYGWTYVEQLKSYVLTFYANEKYK